VIVYFAGNVLSKGDQSMYDDGMRAKLVTFADKDDFGAGGFEYWVYNRPPGARVFLDCGAYSVQSRFRGEKAVIDFDAYCAFCEKWGGNIETYVQLDVVGDPVKTKANLHEMKRRGLSPMPVYTAAAPLEELDALCAEYDHIALGGLRGREAGTAEWRRRQLDRTFEVAAKHWPIKFHAFGITAQWVLERYPIYSADSSGAIVGSGMGRVMDFDRGVISSEPWVGYAQRTHEGLGVDAVGDCGSTGTASAHKGRRTLNIRAQLKFERYLTDLWAQRGVVWDERLRGERTAVPA
jgi:hypothetical protein